MRSTLRSLVLLTVTFFFAISGVSAGECDPEVPESCLEDTATDSLDIVSKDSLSDSTACGDGGCCGWPELPPLPEDPEEVEEAPEEPN